MIKEFILNLLLDNIAMPCDVAKDMIDLADTNSDGQITLRELYGIYRVWKDGGKH